MRIPLSENFNVTTSDKYCRGSTKDLSPCPSENAFNFFILRSKNKCPPQNFSTVRFLRAAEIPNGEKYNFCIGDDPSQTAFQEPPLEVCTDPMV